MQTLRLRRQLAAYSALWWTDKRTDHLLQKRQGNTSELLAQAPWWISVIVAGLVYAFLTWILSGTASGARAQGCTANAGEGGCPSSRERYLGESPAPVY